MAGVDPDYLGEAFLGKGYTVGFLEQEPQLDPTKNVFENVAGGRRREDEDHAPLERDRARASPSRWTTTR